ncbi:MAG: glycosyltransferase family protein [Firmicutes bacterium]|nr:glycosyltransferase family protein [Bacillota bacterium]
MILAILQARVSSTRLPGKVLKPILGEPMLIRQIERVRRARRVDYLLVATSVDPSDDPIEKLCKENNVDCFRGNLDDVLDRFYKASRQFLPEHVVRLTGDCPLADPRLIDEIILHHLNGNYDYTSNTLEPTYPDGLDVEIFRFSCLEQAWREAFLPSQREHVTPFIYQHPDRFKIAGVKNSTNLAALRWTVDEPEDFALVSKIYEALYPSNPGFTTEDILSFLKEHPELLTLNSSYERNEGYQKSLRKDLFYLQES